MWNTWVSAESEMAARVADNRVEAGRHWLRAIAKGGATASVSRPVRRGLAAVWQRSIDLGRRSANALSGWLSVPQEPQGQCCP